MNDLLRLMAKAAIEKVEKGKFKQTHHPKSPPPAEVVKTAARTPSAGVKREVYKRDKCCTKCASTHRLNYYQRQAYALGGLATAENIQLLCFNCNQCSKIRQGLRGK